MTTILQQAAAVRARLQANPAVFKVPSPHLELFVLPNFLNQKDCDALIKKIDADRQPSGLLEGFPDPEFRTSDSCNLNPRDPLVLSIDTRIAQALGIHPRFSEIIQGQRYAVGQQFKPHHDFFYTSQPYWPEQERHGGQRTWTSMAFLNEPEGGGQTAFPNAKVTMSPRRGNLLIWNNLDVNGQPNDFSLHQGMPVLAGVKYIITKWFRERQWIAIPDRKTSR